MKMNKRANLFFAVTIGLAIWIFGILILPFLTDDITTSRAALECSLTSISHGAMLNCLTIDLIVPYFIWFVISIALGFIMGGGR